MAPIRIAITGQSGFIGSRLFRRAAVDPAFACVEFPRSLWGEPEAMRRVLKETDAVIHLAGLSRHADGELLCRTNVELTKQLISAAPEKCRLCLGSTLHEMRDLPYHRSKRESRRLLEERGNSLTLLMANTFGPGSRPFYNSVVSTFCRLAADGRQPERVEDVLLELIYVEDLCREILNALRRDASGERSILPAFTIRLPELWRKLVSWRAGGTPQGTDIFELQLWETFRSYL